MCAVCDNLEKNKRGLSPGAMSKFWFDNSVPVLSLSVKP